MNRTSHRTWTHVVAGAAMLASLATTSVAEAVCHSFNSDTAQSHGIDWLKDLSGDAEVYYEGENGGTISVVGVGGGNPFGSNSLRLVGSGDDYHRFSFDLDAPNEDYPDKVVFSVEAHAGDITVTAYDEFDGLLGPSGCHARWRDVHRVRRPTSPTSLSPAAPTRIGSTTCASSSHEGFHDAPGGPAHPRTTAVGERGSSAVGRIVRAARWICPVAVLALHQREPSRADPSTPGPTPFPVRISSRTKPRSRA